MRFATCATLMCLLLCWAGTGKSVSAATPEFEQTVAPLLQTHCSGCHGPEEQQAGVRLDNLSPNLSEDRAAAEQWQEVLNALNSGEMPPAGEPTLSADQHQALTQWISSAIEHAVDAQRSTGGRTVPRRLNRSEYQQTMTDLLGLEMDYTRDLPPDAVSAEGFLNNGQALQMSALQLEVYLATARRALDRVIVSGPAPPVFESTFTESNVRGWLGNVQRANRLGRQQAFLATMVKDYPEQGAFVIRVRLEADLKPETGFPLLELSVGYRPDTKILFRNVDVVEIDSPEEQTLEFRGRIENHPLPVRGQGKYPGLVIRARNLYDDGSPRPKSEKGKGNNKVFPDESHLPTITIKSLEFKGPAYDQWPPANHRRILFESELQETDEVAYVTEVLKRFMQRAYRRPVKPNEVDRVVDFYVTIREQFPTFEEAIRESLAMVLIRPEFLYLLEPAGDQKRPLSDWELASRLSYFLHGSMPDATLREAADAGRLHQPEVLAEQVERLLDDPRANRFVEQFTNQWLWLDRLDRIAVDRDAYPQVDESLKAEMRRETQQFFKHLIVEDHSALNLLDSDFTMLNQPLAEHYGIPGIYGRQFRAVKLPPEQHRGGLLGQASVLLSNSTGAESHPIRRAVWIRDRLLADPPAPPPPDVPSLDEADPKFLKLSVREQLEMHRESKACASCHRDIDPWGLALENFDAVGLWRDAFQPAKGKPDEAQAVDSTVVLPDDRQIDGVDGLKKYLVTHRHDAFARSLVSRLLTYALGRRLELSDRPDIDRLAKQFMQDDYRLRRLIQNIVASPAFQTK